MSWETVYWVSQLLLVVLAGVALVSGAVVNKRQSGQLLTLETNLEGQRHETEGLKKSNIEAQSALEKERTARLEMEKALALRQLAISFNKGESNVDSLKPFAGIQFILRSLPDAEPARAALSLIEVLGFAGWVRIGREISPEYNSPTYDGVTISTIVGAKDTGRENDAVTALLELLKRNGWEARRGAPEIETPNTVQITIGFKRSPYFLTKDMKDVMERVDQARKRAEEAGKRP